MALWETRSERLRYEEEGRSQCVWPQHCFHIEASIGSTLFNRLHCVAEDEGERQDILFDGQLACVHYVAQMLVLLAENLLVDPAGTCVRFFQEDLEQAGWERIPLENAIRGDIIFWDFFRSMTDRKEGQQGNQHVGFLWSQDYAVSTARIDPSTDDSLRAPQKHPIYFDGPNRIDGPRTILSVWTHPKLRASYAQMANS